MAVEKNIVMKEFNGTDYDTLYPKTIGTQVDGVFTSEQTLTSDTLAKYQLSASAVPDDVFSWLGKYAQYWWRRRQPTTVYTTTESPSTKKVYIIYNPGSTSATRPINYSDSISVDQSTGTISLVNPQTVDVSYSNRGTTVDGTLAGKYVTNLYTDPSTVYKFATTPVYSRDTSRYSLYFDTGNVTVVSSVGTQEYTDWEYLQSNNRNAYSDTGYSNVYVVELGPMSSGVQITNAYETRNIYYSSEVGFNNDGTPYLIGETSLSINYNSGADTFNLLKGKYVRNIWYSNSASSDIYFLPSDTTIGPDNGYVVANTAYKVGSKLTPVLIDGYEYEFLGKPLDNAVTASKIEIGSYVGTGAYGQNNPNTLTFPQKPKLVLFGSAESVETQGYTNQGFIYYGITTIFTTNTSSDYINDVTYSGNTMSWYCEKSASAQYNNQKTTYYYTVFY